ncbi:ribosome biogenesis factor YjgA [Pseudohalioglobus lutimaris]|uniref:Dual-action ribosomal maturation protein DarP n=1 Tax=Pseudohalioglobus lutimaris TaxID=1737061 RepID=A0A2N5X695_9GAMM|nr:ribosome biogenesis factor YjgA [Pseudohalioglobus lutimaris]PLW69997.1 DUF615 domain-containing protein [Pseudohalioglobus lutimaris]
MRDPQSELDDGQEEGPSKSELKRQMHARQSLGEELTQLNDQQLDGLPIADEQLLRAIRETRRIRSKNALRRHLQYVGKLMRNIDPEPITEALEQMRRPASEASAAFHQLERLREDVLVKGVSGVEMVIQRWPQADRQQLRQLVLQHQREQKLGKPPAASRKLFRYLRELQDNHG